MDQSSELLLQSVRGELAQRVHAMEAALAQRGIRVRVTSAKRSTAQQERLYAARGSNPYPVARPGTSKHELGLAVDLVPVGAQNSSLFAAMGEEGERAGLRWGGRFARRDPVHFELPSDDGGVALPDVARVGVQSNAGSMAMHILIFGVITVLIVKIAE